ncbi:unnamed protein product, partial [Rotaria sp. Silwood2]
MILAHHLATPVAASAFATLVAASAFATLVAADPTSGFALAPTAAIRPAASAY